MTGFGHSAEPRSGTGETQEWLTPRWIFEALDMEFDLDPCSPASGPVPWIPATRHYTRADDGLSKRWEGRVWLNPPYGRNLTGAFLRKLASHRDGVALVFARTETKWAQAAMRAADAVVFIDHRIGFVRDEPTGEARKRPNGGPGAGAGSMLLVYGSRNVDPVLAAGLGVSFRAGR